MKATDWIETCEICSQQFEGADMIPVGDVLTDDAAMVCQGCIITQADEPKRGGK